jgi:hypothetical protein
MSSDAEYRQEVEEWTRSLRSKRSFGDLRDELEEKGLNWRTALLAWFGENEAGEEHGAVVTATGRVYRFTREQNKSGEWRFTAFLDATDDPRLREDFRDEIEAALAMIRERESPDGQH